MELCYEGGLVMPKNFVTVESDEMEYIDGGWSATMVENNILGILKKCGSRATSVIPWASVSSFSKYGYITLCAKFGTKIVRTVMIIGGVIAAVVAALSMIAAVSYLGNHRVYY